jgi:hypothetical protein
MPGIHHPLSGHIYSLRRNAPRSTARSPRRCSLASPCLSVLGSIDDCIYAGKSESCEVSLNWAEMIGPASDMLVGWKADVTNHIGRGRDVFLFFLFSVT